MTFGILKEFPRIYNWKRNKKWIKKCRNNAGLAFDPRLRLAGLAKGALHGVLPSRSSRRGHARGGVVAWPAPVEQRPNSDAVSGASTREGKRFCQT
jgi:hypothetical protein